MSDWMTLWKEYVALHNELEFAKAEIAHLKMKLRKYELGAAADIPTTKTTASPAPASSLPIQEYR